MQWYKIDLLFALINRKIVEKYIGSVLEILWVILSPLVPLLTTLLVFFYMAALPSATEMGVWGYSIYVLTGLIPYRILQRAITDGCDLVVLNLDLLKQAVFPFTFLSLTSIGALLFEFLVQVFFLLIIMFMFGDGLSFNLLLLPIATLLFLGLLLGMSWMLSIIGYLIRDIREVMTVIFTALLYITPIMYPTTAVPKAVQNIMLFNPLTHITIVFRDALLPHSVIHMESWVYMLVITGVFFVMGYLTISKAGRYAGDLV